MLTTHHVVLPAAILPSLCSPGLYSRHVGSRNLRLVSRSEAPLCEGSAQNIQGEVFLLSRNCFNPLSGPFSTLDESQANISRRAGSSILENLTMNLTKVCLATYMCLIGFIRSLFR